MARHLTAPWGLTGLSREPSLSKTERTQGTRTATKEMGAILHQIDVGCCSIENTTPLRDPGPGVCGSLCRLCVAVEEHPAHPKTNKGVRQWQGVVLWNCEQWPPLTPRTRIPRFCLGWGRGWGRDSSREGFAAVRQFHSLCTFFHGLNSLFPMNFAFPGFCRMSVVLSLIFK